LPRITIRFRPAQGISDDGSGVAAVLENRARAEVIPAPRHPVIVLIDEARKRACSAHAPSSIPPVGQGRARGDQYR